VINRAPRFILHVLSEAASSQGPCVENEAELRVLFLTAVLMSGGVFRMAAEQAESPTMTAVQQGEAGGVGQGSVASDPSLDSAAGLVMLRLANQARAKLGLEPLAWNEALATAAQAHGREMLRRGELSHQFAGEPDLMTRLGTTGAHFNRAGENVAYDYSAEHAQESFMNSEAHRHNLLDPSFNAAGIAIVPVQGQIYVVQDFAHQLPLYDPGEAEELIAKKVEVLRDKSRLPRLNRVKSPAPRDSCSPNQRKQTNADFANARYVVSYSNAEPEILPASAGNVIADGQTRNYSVGACYARTEKNPTGAYFVTMTFY
jgi:uncharacterized protein YkwD